MLVSASPWIAFKKKYVNFINAEDLSQDSNNLQSFLTVDAGYCIPLKNECLFFDLVANRCEQEVQKRKLNYSTFNLNEEHYEKGVNFLKTCGLPKDSWYVTIHVREPGYRSETVKNLSQRFNISGENPIFMSISGPILGKIFQKLISGRGDAY